MMDEAVDFMDTNLYLENVVVLFSLSEWMDKIVFLKYRLIQCVTRSLDETCTVDESVFPSRQLNSSAVQGCFR
jgi:hypothetical protein